MIYKLKAKLLYLETIVCDPLIYNGPSQVILSNQTISLGHVYSTDKPGHNKLYSIQSCIAHYSDPVRINQGTE